MLLSLVLHAYLAHHMFVAAEHNLLAQACFKVSIQDRAGAADLLSIVQQQ